MPIADHAEFKEQPHDDSKLWRYMDLSKFVSFLSTGALFFTRADRFEDTWEGTVTRNNIRASRNVIASESSAAKQETLPQ